MVDLGDLDLNDDQIHLSSSDSYDSNYYRDDSDYENLMKMSEFEREKILFKRAEKRRFHDGRKKAKKAVLKENYKETKEKQKANKKFKSESNVQSRLELKLNEAIASIAEGPFSKKCSPRALHRGSADKIADLPTVKTCYLRRDGMAKIFKEPYLEEYIKGMFVKITTGIDDYGNSKYFLAQIDELRTQEKKYRFYDGVTNYILVLRRGLATKICRFDLLSNSSISEEEYLEWRKVLRSQESQKGLWMKQKFAQKNSAKLDYNEAKFIKDMAHDWIRLTAIPSKAALLQRARTADGMRADYVYTEKDFKRMESNINDGSIRKVGNVTRELIRIRGKMDSAKAKGNDEEYNLLQRKEMMLKNYQKRRKSEIIDESEKIIEKTTKTFDEWAREKTEQNGRENDAFQRKTTRSLVQRFGVENQKKEFKKMEKKIDSLRSLRAMEMNKSAQEREAKLAFQSALARGRKKILQIAEQNFSWPMKAIFAEKSLGNRAENEKTVYKDPMHNLYAEAMSQVDFDFAFSLGDELQADSASLNPKVAK